MMMQLGAETVFVGSGIFMKEGNIRLEVGLDPSGHPLSPEERAEAESRAKAIVLAATHHNDPAIIAQASEDCLGAMKGLAVAAIDESEMMQHRGW
jgi:pyridoxal 5'-phosphate synthase pdxS subunit